MHGGEGNDTITGRNGPDDIFGDEGNDILSGLAGDDELWGGDGDDILRGGTNNTGSNRIDVLKGGSGSDKLYGGTSTARDGGNAGVADDKKYLYGDEGDDLIWGSSNISE